MALGSPWIAEIDGFDAYRAVKLPAPAARDPQPDGDQLIPGYCALCNEETQFRLGAELWHPDYGFFFREALSCAHCTLNARMRAALQYARDVVKIDSNSHIYLTERVTALYDFVKERYPNSIGSEFLPDTPIGESVDGIRCEDLTRLTFSDSQFDAIFSFDVLEHVPDYRAAAREMFRTLRLGGQLLLTAPLCMDRHTTVHCARLMDDGSIYHITSPAYHGNPLGPPSLCFSDFGWEVLDAFREAGFSNPRAVLYYKPALGYSGQPQPLIVACK